MIWLIIFGAATITFTSRFIMFNKTISNRIKEYVKNNNHELIETLIENIAQMILKDFDVEYITLSISKPGAIRDSKDVGITITRSN